MEPRDYTSTSTSPEVPERQKPDIPSYIKAVAALLTAIATLVGVFIGRATASSPAPQATVTVIDTVTARPNGGNSTLDPTNDPSTPEPSTTASVGTVSPAANPGDGQPVSANLVDQQKIDAGAGGGGGLAVTMGGTVYPNSLVMYCDDYGSSWIIYSVSGFKTLRATLGVTADSPDFGGSASVQVTGSNGASLSSTTAVSNRTQQLVVNVAGLDQIKISCVAHSATGKIDADVHVALGSATLTQ